MEETGNPFHGFLGDSHDVLVPILAAEEAKWPEVRKGRGGGRKEGSL